MAFTWKNGSLYFDLPYWVIQDYGFSTEEVTGIISIDIKCEKLDDNIPQKNVKDIEKIIVERCDPTIDSLQKIHRLDSFQLVNFIANVIWEQRIDADTIESDAERKNRIINGTRKNKREFYQRSSCCL